MTRSQGSRDVQKGSLDSHWKELFFWHLASDRGPVTSYGCNHDEKEKFLGWHDG
jgi:hypothetical protein